MAPMRQNEALLEVIIGFVASAASGTLAWCLRAGLEQNSGANLPDVHSAMEARKCRLRADMNNELHSGLACWLAQKD